MQNRASANALDSPLLKPTASSASTYEPEVSEESLLVKSSAPQIHLFKSQVILNPTISRINFVAYLFFTCYNAFILLPVGLLQMPLLKIHYGMSQSAAINAATILQLVQLGYKTFIVYPILGAAVDKYGRKPFIVVGVIAMNVAIFLSPNLPAVFPYWYLDMILQDLGMTCLLIVPLIADYIDYETKGRVAGIASVFIALMAFISTFITSAINVEDNIPTEYHAFGIGGLVVGLIICLGIKGGPYHKNLFFDAKAEEAKQKANQQIEQERIKQEDELNPEETIRLRAPSITNAAPDEKPGFKVGIKEAQRNPWILLGYLANFLFFSEIMLVNALLVNYVNTVTGTTDSTNQAYNLTNKQALVQVFGGIFFGFAADKLNKFKILVFIVVSSIIAVILLMISPTPYNFLAYLSMVFFGISLSGFLTFVTQVTSKYPTPKFRASVMAVSSMCGLVGSAMTSILGMFLSQFDISIPFYIYLGAAVVGLFTLIGIYIAKRDILNRL